MNERTPSGSPEPSQAHGKVPTSSGFLRHVAAQTSDAQYTAGWRQICQELLDAREALGKIAELGERCEDCEPTEAAFATWVTAHPLTGIPIFLCDEHVQDTRDAHRKAESKGCGKQPEIEPHEQEMAVDIALKALGSLAR